MNSDNTINKSKPWVVSKVNIENELTKDKKYEIYNTYQSFNSTQLLIVNDKNYEKYYDKENFHFEVMN